MEHKQILEAIEEIRGHTVDIACSCGMGRRTPEIAETLIDMSRKLTTA
jgi:hypothetical protein